MFAIITVRPDLHNAIITKTSNNQNVSVWCIAVFMTHCAAHDALASSIIKVNVVHTIVEITSVVFTATIPAGMDERLALSIFKPA